MIYASGSVANQSPGGKYRFITLSLIIAADIYLWLIYPGNRPIVSPLPDNRPAAGGVLGTLFNREKTKNPEELKAKIIKQIGNSWKNYSVSVADYSSGLAVRIDDTVIFTAVSVNKVPILAALYFLHESGAVDMDRTITLQKQDIQDYGTGSIRYDPPGTTYSVKTLAKLMMKQSDNTAAHLLAEYVIGAERLQNIVNGFGLTQTDIALNKTSNRDMEILFDLIYANKITSPAYTKEMLSFMRDTDFEDRIPALLPPGTAVYHKIGNGVGFVHDAGIVVSPGANYYLGVFTSDISDEPGTIRLIGEISKSVYDFMQ